MIIWSLRLSSALCPVCIPRELLREKKREDILPQTSEAFQRRRIPVTHRATIAPHTVAWNLPRWHALKTSRAPPQGRRIEREEVSGVEEAVGEGRGAPPSPSPLTSSRAKPWICDPSSSLIAASSARHRGRREPRVDLCRQVHVHQGAGEGAVLPSVPE
jgi:hypothetical protein